MLVLVTPGALELVEDVAHYAMHGDSLHDGEHEEQHCCSGAFHVCSCHGHARAVLMTPAAFAVEVDTIDHTVRAVHPRPHASAGPLDGYSRGVIRPPAA